MTFNSLNKQQYFINDAIKRVTNYAFLITNLEDSIILPEDFNIYFVEKNLFSDLHGSLQDSTGIYYQFN